MPATVHKSSRHGLVPDHTRGGAKVSTSLPASGRVVTAGVVDLPRPSRNLATRPMDLCGQTVGHWSVIELATRKPRPQWLCRCKCGTVKRVLAWHLTSGES